LDGQVYAQPLYLAGVPVSGKGRHNVVFVCTEGDSVYAFDADSNAGGNSTPLWHVNFTNPAAGITTVPSADVYNSPQITPVLGITSTPVIDGDAGTIYVVAMTKEVSGTTTRYVHRLHALDITSGTERSNSPVEVQATYTFTFSNGTKKTYAFRPVDYKQRPGLLLLNGTIYTSWSSHSDQGAYHGWLIAYDAISLKQTAVFSNTSNAIGASFWQSGAAPAADANGNIYVVGGNGPYDLSLGNIGNSVLRMSTQNGGLALADHFAPFNINTLNLLDKDLGSCGALLLPDEVGSPDHPHLLLGAGKEGRIYLLDRDNLGTQSANDANAVQTLLGAVNGVYGIAAYYNGTVYFSAQADNLKAFSIQNAQLSTTPTSQAGVKFAYPGSVPVVSASGVTGGIVWVIENKTNARLHAYDASNLAKELYNSDQMAADSLDRYVKFTTPTVTNGRVYVGTAAALTAFGLNNVTPAGDVTTQVTVKRGGFRYDYTSKSFIQTVQVKNAGSVPITGPLSLVLDNLSAGAKLTSGGGVTTSYAAPTGSFYQSITPPGGAIAPGGTLVFDLAFTNPSNQAISYATRVLAEGGAR
jgi:hypothetical protein